MPSASAPSDIPSLDNSANEERILVFGTRGQENHTTQCRHQGTAEVKIAVCIGHLSKCALGTADLDKVDDRKHSTIQMNMASKEVEGNSELPDQLIQLIHSLKPSLFLDTEQSPDSSTTSISSCRAYTLTQVPSED